jgi:aliphatic nitrilase
MAWNKELFRNAVEVPSPATEALAQAAREARINVAIGVCEKEAGQMGTMYNSLLFFDREGRLIGRHRKLVPTQGERMVHTGGFGDSLQALPMDFGRMSGLLCGENSNPLAVYALIARGTNVHVCSWPPHFNPGPDMASIVLIASRAIAYQAKAFVINAVGVVSDQMRKILPASDVDRAFLERVHDGSSIIGPYGQILAGPMGREEGILYADADLNDIIGPKIVQDLAGHYNRADILQLHINAAVPPRLVADGQPAGWQPVEPERHKRDC